MTTLTLCLEGLTLGQCGSIVKEENSKRHKANAMGNSKKKLIKMVDRMPAFPQSVHLILQLTSNIDCDPRDLVRVVDHDPVLTLHLLKLVNSPYFGLSRKISSIKQAVVFVGINTMKNLALSVAPLGVLPKKTRSTPLVNTLLLHSVATAVIARRIAKNQGISETQAADYFVAGLLHDFGKVVFARCLPKLFLRATKQALREKRSLLKVEKEIIGLDHTEIGALLGKKWRLPKKLAASMCDQTNWDTDKSSPIQRSVYTAHLIASTLDYGHYASDGLKKNLEAATHQWFGMSPENFILSLGNISEEVNRAHARTKH